MVKIPPLVSISGYVLDLGGSHVSQRACTSCCSGTGPLKESSSEHCPDPLHLWNTIKFNFPHSQPMNPTTKITKSGPDSWSPKLIFPLPFSLLQRQRGHSQRGHWPPGKQIRRLSMVWPLLSSSLIVGQTLSLIAIRNEVTWLVRPVELFPIQFMRETRGLWFLKDLAFVISKVIRTEWYWRNSVCYHSVMRRMMDWN